MQPAAGTESRESQDVGELFLPLRSRLGHGPLSELSEGSTLGISGTGDPLTLSTILRPDVYLAAYCAKAVRDMSSLMRQRATPEYGMHSAQKQ